jgi:hypothetical protein
MSDMDNPACPEGAGAPEPDQQDGPPPRARTRAAGRLPVAAVGQHRPHHGAAPPRIRDRERLDKIDRELFVGLLRGAIGAPTSCAAASSPAVAPSPSCRRSSTRSCCWAPSSCAQPRHPLPRHHQRGHRARQGLRRHRRPQVRQRRARQAALRIRPDPAPLHAPKQGGGHTELAVRRRFTRRAGWATPALIRAGMQLAVSTDMLVAGTHFFADTDPEGPGLEDAGGERLRPRRDGRPAPLGLPRRSPAGPDEAWIAAFARGFFACADAFGIDLAGGDTTRGPLTPVVTIIGEVPVGAAITRAGGPAWRRPVGVRPARPRRARPRGSCAAKPNWTAPARPNASRPATPAAARRPRPRAARPRERHARRLRRPARRPRPHPRVLRHWRHQRSAALPLAALPPAAPTPRCAGAACSRRRRLRAAVHGAAADIAERGVLAGTARPRPPPHRRPHRRAQRLLLREARRRLAPWPRTATITSPKTR